MKFYFVLEHVGGRGGVETVLKQTINLLEEKGHKTKVFLPIPSDYTEWEKELSSVIYYDADRSNSHEIDLVNRSLGLSNMFAKMEKPDVVVATHVPHTALYARMAIGRNSFIPIVSWLHNPINTFNYPGFINYADVHWAISKEIVAEVEQFQFKQATIHYLGNVIETKHSSINITKNNHYVYVGRLENKQKRIDILFSALSMLSFDWTLSIYGDGEDRFELVKLANKLNIIDNIQFKGWDANPWEKIHEAKALLISSEFEGFGLVIGEALSRGLPVISSNVSGPRDLIEDNINGWLFKKNNIDDLVNKLNILHSFTLDELKNVSTQASLSVEKFSGIHIFQRMKESLADFIDEEAWNL